MEFNTIDLVILIPILFGLYKGYVKGLILSVATLLGLIIGVWAGIKFSYVTSQFLFERFQIDIPLLSFGLTFLVVLIAMYFIGKLLSKFADIIALGLVNNIGGALFGAGKAILILTIVLIFFESLNTNFHLVENELLSQSILYKYLQEIGELVFPFLDDLKKSNNISI